MTVSPEITVVDTFAGLTGLKEDRDRLHQMGKPDSFRGYAWVRCWLRHFGEKENGRSCLPRRMDGSSGLPRSR